MPIDEPKPVEEPSSLVYFAKTNLDKRLDRPKHCNITEVLGLCQPHSRTPTDDETRSLEISDSSRKRDLKAREKQLSDPLRQNIKSWASLEGAKLS